MTVRLFVVCVLLWGGGALATAMQGHVTPAAWSVAMRMGLAGAILLGGGWAAGIPVAIARRNRLAVAIQGVLFFSLAFIAFYEATRRIPSGLAALVLSTSPLIAALISRVALGTALAPALLWGALCGLAGTTIIFGGDLGALGSGSGAGLAWALAASVATAGGTVAGARNQRAGVPALALLGWSAVAGAVASAVFALAAGERLTLDLSPRYWASLAYLVLAASCLTFLCYFELVRRLGSGRAAYTLAAVPVVALLLSALFEHLHLGPNLILGTAAVLLGNYLVLRNPAAGAPPAAGVALGEPRASLVMGRSDGGDQHAD